MRHRLTVRLPALVVLCVVLVAGLGAGAASLSGRDALRRQALTGVTRSLDTYLSSVRQYFQQARATLRLTAGHVGPERTATGPGLGAREDAATVLDGMLASSRVFEYVMLLGSDGRVQVARPATARRRLAGASFGRRSWLARARSGQVAISDLEVALATGNPTLVVAIPVRGRDGTAVAVLAAGLRLATLSAMGAIPGGHAARAAHGFLTDRYGLIIAHQGTPAFVRDQTDFSSVFSVRAALAGRRGAGFGFDEVEGREKLAAFAPLPETGGTVVFAEPAADALAPLSAVTRRWALVGGVVTALASVLFAVLVARALHPLSTLREAAASIGTGNLATRIEATTQDEIGLLTQEFNRMAGGLAEREARLTSRSRQLAVSNAQLQVSHAQLEVTNAELEAFSQAVSHDLRAPLRAIDGFTRLVIEDHGDTLPAETRSRLERVRAAAQRMALLIDELLALSRLSRRPMDVVDVDLSALARNVLAELLAAQPDRRVQADIDEGIMARGDPTLLRSVLQNLFENALKFSAGVTESRISFAVEERDGERTFVVRDNGCGFDPRFADRLFRPFERLHTVAEFDGAGIGLATVQRIVQRHGGRVWGEGQLGEGAAFGFSLASEPSQPHIPIEGPIQ